ncbi:magnesium transporter [Engelhardtia mirabilis]|uniref:Magnesium transporter MgtE n=1 Tax=Engelhardtia mirabilis TaxID=2528011 RepID=A0A518BRY2_9BACT|nr:Magnesium transporter MgtE [Planctomycetes bacterium Pla133]QDV04057.1 Magnesium transporter MgtE [Planctomycetes bacterium Pla86]
MSEKSEEKSWQDLERLVGTSDMSGAEALLAEMSAGETARAVSRLDVADRDQLLASMSAEGAANLVDELPEAQAVELLERMDPERAADVLLELSSDERADLVTELDRDDAEQILAELPPLEAAQIRALAAYDKHVAGGLMATEFLVYPQDASVGEVVNDLRRRVDEYEDEDIQYVYVIASTGALAGVLRLRDLLLSPSRLQIGGLMIPEPLTVLPDASLDQLADLFDTHAFLGLPVVDAIGIPIGVVQRADVEEAVGGRSDSDYLKTAGIVGGEEFRSMPLWSRSLRRLSWLTPNIALNLIAASVIAAHEETIAAVVALAFFLPIISDMSGCSGNQAIAVSVRELTLGLVRPTELFYVWVKEIRVGLINGLALGLVMAGVAWAWQGNGYLGLAVGAAMFINTLVSVSMGGLIPQILKRFGQDPALASGPILTTATDMCGFFLLLTFASHLLPYLTPS